MAKIKVTLSNDFHKTRTALFLEPGEVLSHRRVKAIRRRLCGVVGCTCSGNLLGCRGDQEWHTVPYDFIPTGEYNDSLIFSFVVPYEHAGKRLIPLTFEAVEALDREQLRQGKSRSALIQTIGKWEP